EVASLSESSSRGMKAGRELDQTRARAAVLTNRVATGESHAAALLSTLREGEARTKELEEGYGILQARASEAESLSLKVSDLLATVEAFKGQGEDAAARLKALEELLAGAEAAVTTAQGDAAQARAELEAKSDQVLQITAQRNSVKSRADSLARDLSR
ncbi:unnamed protein product, partial [Choristocarpus tenellus]